MNNTYNDIRSAVSRIISRYSLAITVFLLAAVSGCASGLGLGGFNLISIEEEWQMGQQLERQIASELTLVNDATANAYINSIGQRIVSQTPMANLPWKFHIVADPAINAFNVPGGHVYVNTGLIAAADNVSELAGVMAHEIAHGVERHGTERITQVYGLNVIASLVLGQNPDILEQIVAQVVGTGTVASMSRGAEREADQLGVRYMHAAGYNPDGMASFFGKLLAEEGRGSSSVERFFATHPLTQDRIRDVERQAASLPNRQGLITRDQQLGSVKQRVARYNR